MLHMSKACAPCLRGGTARPGALPELSQLQTSRPSFWNSRCLHASCRRLELPLLWLQRCSVAWEAESQAADFPARSGAAGQILPGKFWHPSPLAARDVERRCM